MQLVSRQTPIVFKKMQLPVYTVHETFRLEYDPLLTEISKRCGFIKQLSHPRRVNGWRNRKRCRCKWNCVRVNAAWEKKKIAGFSLVTRSDWSLLAHEKSLPSNNQSDLCPRVRVIPRAQGQVDRGITPALSSFYKLTRVFSWGRVNIKQAFLPFLFIVRQTQCNVTLYSCLSFMQSTKFLFHVGKKEKAIWTKRENWMYTWKSLWI